jgi:ATP-binding cassette subfamily B multidrug efflux pump
VKSLKHLNKYFAKYKYRLVLGILFVIASNLFSAFPAKVVGLAVDLVVENLKLYQLLSTSHSAHQVSKNVAGIVVFFAILVVVFALLRGLFMYLMRQNIIVMSRLIEFDLKNEIFKHYQKLPLAFYRKNNTGDLMARISEDVSRVRMYIGPAIMYFTNLIATFLIVIPIMVAVHAKLAFFVLLPLPILSYAIFYVNNIINRKSDEIQRQLSNLTSYVQETFSGIRVIKAFAGEAHFRGDFEKEAELYKQKNLSLAKVDAMFFPLMVFLTGLSTLITVVLGGIYVLKGEINIGHIAEFVIYVNLLTWPVTSLGWTFSLVQRAAASQHRINEFLHVTPDIVNNNHQPFTFNNEMVFNKVSYRYTGKNEYALKNIEFTLNKGNTLAILGTTGSGKTTLVQLMLRMMDVTNGTITVDGVDIKDINIESYKDQIGYVPQEVFLFSDTIENNIAFGLKHNVENKTSLVEWAAKQADLHSNIKSFTHGYQTMVGERGISLSGGQKQRVSLARAFIKNPDILILDDSLSAVDTKTEAKILDNLKQLLAGKTALIISHRVSTVKDADLILVLDEGEIVERGTHENLIETGGRYAELYARQLSD